MNVTHIQSEQFQDSFKHRLPLSVWEASRAAAIFFFVYFIYLFSLLLLCCETLSAPGPSKGQWFVDVSSICDIEWFNLATREWVKSVIVLILSSDFYALHWLPSYPPVPLERQQKANGSTPDTGWIYYAASKPSHVLISAETRSLQMKIQT